MANTIAIRTHVDGPTSSVIQACFISDGSSGEITNQVVVDVSALTPVPKYVSITKIEYATAGCNVGLKFDATTDTPAWLIPPDSGGCFDFTAFGGIPDKKDTGYTGDVIASTAGFTAAGDRAAMMIYVKKHF